MGLTYVTGAELHPFNSGVILIDPGRGRVAQSYLAAIDALVAGYPPEHQSWYGDQMAIAALLGDPEFAPCTDEVMDREANGIRYRLLPAAEWNYSADLDATADARAGEAARRPAAPGPTIPTRVRRGGNGAGLIIKILSGLALILLRTLVSNRCTKGTSLRLVGQG